MPRVTIQVPERTPQPYRFHLDSQLVTLGRGEENDIVIDCGSVSANHAEMRRVLGGYELVDVGSTNGIKLNGVRQPLISLYNGADVRLGEVEFAFLLSDEELASLNQEQGGYPPLQSEPAPPAPLSARNAPPPRPISMAPPKSSFSFAALLMFLILIALAFFAGLALRHQEETGKSLIQAIQAKYLAPPPPQPPALPAPEQKDPAASP